MTTRKPDLKAIPGGERAPRIAELAAAQIEQAEIDGRLVLGAMLGHRNAIPQFEEILNGGGAFPSEELCTVYQTVIDLYQTSPDLIEQGNLAAHLLGKVKLPHAVLQDIDDAFESEFASLEVGLEAARRMEKRYGDEYMRREAVRIARSPDPIEAFRETEQRVATPRKRPFPETELGVCDRFLEDHGDELLYVTKFAAWFSYDGKRWVEGAEGRARRWAQETARSLFREAESERTDERRKFLLGLARKAESKRAIDATLGLAWPKREAEPDEFNRDPYLFNVANGTIDLRTGELRPHRREDRLSKISAVEYDPKATCPRWEDFLGEIFPGDSKMIAFLQRAVGWSLTGDIADRKFFVALGTGRNGKSTFLNTVSRAIGTYAATADFETFLEQPVAGRRVRDDLAHLAGARFVSAVEAGQGRSLDCTLLKALTGGEMIRCRHLFGREFEYAPAMKLWLAANHAPRVKDATDSTWDRLLRIPFEVRIADDRVDKTLPRKLVEELPGILAWCVAGAFLWYQNGLNPPAKVLSANRQYREAEDPLGGFLEGEAAPFVRAPGQKVELKTVRDAYNVACQGEGEEPIGRNQFSAALEEKGLRIRRNSGKRYVYGLATKGYLGDLGFDEPGRSAESAVSDLDS